MKKIHFLAMTLVLLFCVSALWANPPLPRAQAPVYTTAFGQSPDSNFVNVLARRVGLNQTHMSIGNPEGAEWNNARTLIAVIGGSMKGLGAAGVGVPAEIRRCDSFITSARAQNKFIIGMHIGGEDRRGPTSQDFLHFASEVDFLIVRADGNRDGFFTRLASERGIPLYTIEHTREIERILREIFEL